MFIMNPLELSVDETSSELFKVNEIEYKKSMNSLRKGVRQAAKRRHCLYCKKEVESFCNSHTIPDFVLRYIANNGIVRTFNSILNIEIYEKEKGVKSAGTFHQICRKCDSEIFRKYEDEVALTNRITDQMIYEIAMKNYLKMIDKRLIELELNRQVTQLEPMRYVQEMDLQEYLVAFDEAKKYDLLNKRHKYRILVDELLHYRVPIAFQGGIPLIVDLEGNIINDVYCMSEKYKIEELHLCIFPLKSNTRILMFVNREYTHYERITKNRMKKLSFSDLLSLINYIVFLYSEEVYIKGDLSEEILRQLLDVSKMSTPMIFGTDIFEQTNTESDRILKEMYDLNKRNTIPNLLAENYKVVV